MQNGNINSNGDSNHHKNVMYFFIVLLYTDIVE